MGKSKIIIWIAMYMIASYPLIIGVLQLIDYYMVMTSDSDGMFYYLMMLGYSTPAILLACLVLSYWQKFCVYHKIVIISILFIQILSMYDNPFLFTLDRNIINLSVMLVLLYSVPMCIIHFYIQIKQFIRYVRSKE